MASRHRSRELAVQVCYQWALDAKSIADPKVLERFWREQALASSDTRDFFEFLIRGVADNLPAIDRAMEGVLQNWKMSRVEKVDLAILRLAIFELLFCPPAQRPDSAVIINEAVEIAKKFGNKGSPAFINGILDAINAAPPHVKAL